MTNQLSFDLEVLTTATKTKTKKTGKASVKQDNAYYLDLHQKIISETITDKNGNKQKVEKIEYTFSKDYVAALKGYWAVKEILANYLDENGTDFYMNYKSPALILQDKGTGIEIKYMLVGNSGSRGKDDKIGQFGEGMNISIFLLVHLGYKVLVDTVGYTIAFDLEYSDLLKSNVVIGKYTSNERTVGTDFYLECKKPDFEKAKKMFLPLIEHEEVTKNIIWVPSNSKEQDIFLNGLSHMRKRAIFSYNIVERTFITNRDRNFIQQNILEEYLLKYYNNIEESEAVKTIINRFLEVKNDFDKTLEARLVEQFDFSDDLKKKFKNALPKKVYFIKNERDIVPDDKSTPIVVNEKLFIFLEYIGANVITESGDYVSEDEAIIHSFAFEKSKLPDEAELEMAIAELVGDSGTLEDGQSVYSIHKFDMLSEESIKKLNLSFKVFTKTPKNEFKNLFNNLILLSCFKTDISFENSGVRYTLEAKVGENKVQVFVIRESVSGYDSKLTIKKETPFDKEGKKYLKQKENFIYLQQLRYKSITSIYSYQVDKLDSVYYYTNLENRVNKSVEKMVSDIALEEPKPFFESLFSGIGVGVLEEGLNIDINKKNKDAAQKAFKKVYKKTCLSSNPFYNQVVSERYGYQVLNLQYGQLRSLLETKLGIENAEQIYSAKQREDIHTIEYTQEMTQAVAFFKESMPLADVDIKLTALLPDNKESTNKDGIIYISQTATKIPEYIAALILFEYEQIRLDCASPSHELQYILTHNLLG